MISDINERTVPIKGNGRSFFL